MDDVRTSLFRDAAQIADTFTKLGITGTTIDAGDQAVRRTRIDSANEFLQLVVIGLHNGRGCARIADACRVLSAPQLALVTGLMTAAEVDFDAIDTWLVS